MRCYICDSVLNPKEIEYEHDHKRYAPCIACKKASSDGSSYRHGTSIDEVIDELMDTLLIDPSFDDAYDHIEKQKLDDDLIDERI